MDFVEMWTTMANHLGDFCQNIMKFWEWLLTPLVVLNITGAPAVEIAPIWLLSGAGLVIWLGFVFIKETISN